MDRSRLHHDPATGTISMEFELPARGPITLERIDLPRAEADAQVASLQAGLNEHLGLIVPPRLLIGRGRTYQAGLPSCPE